jgi:hypothetical protein
MDRLGMTFRGGIKMTETELPAEERVIDRGDWPSATISLIFLIGFPIGIAAMTETLHH